MNKNCYGCGVLLQDNNKNMQGYVQDLNNDEHLLCQRCFKMTNYNEYHSHYLDDDTFRQIIKTSIKKQNLVVLVVDLFDLSGSLCDEIISIIKNNPVIIVGTKRDVILKSVKDRKIKEYLKQICLDYNLNVVDIIITSAKKKYQVDELLDSIFSNYKQKDVYVVGVTNVGKSSIINALMNSIEKQNQQITISNYPGTTLDTIKIDLDDNNYLYDTPGLVNKKQIIHYLDISNYKYLQTKKEIKARIYQLNESQSVFIGGLACFSFISGDKTGYTFYFNNSLKLHRTKYDVHIDLFNNHLNDDILIPKISKQKNYNEFKVVEFDLSDFSGKVDIVIDGLGWISFVANKQKVSMSIPKEVGCEIRKAFI